MSISLTEKSLPPAPQLVRLEIPATAETSQEDFLWLVEHYARAVAEEMAVTPLKDVRRFDVSRIEEIVDVLVHLLANKNGTICLLAKVRGRCVGYFLGLTKDCPAEEPPRVGYINGLYVTAEMRRDGIGQKLLDAGVVWFRQQGIKLVELYLAIGNEAGKKFWVKNGYLPAEELFAKQI